MPYASAQPKGLTTKAEAEDPHETYAKAVSDLAAISANKPRELARARARVHHLADQIDPYRKKTA